MDIRVVITALAGFIAWASVTKIQFVLLGYQFIIPVLVVVLFILALVILLLIALIIRSLVTGGTVIGGTA